MTWIIAPLPWNMVMHGIRFLANAIPEGVPILHPLTLENKILGAAITTIPLIISELILYFLIKLFTLYRQSKIFTLQNVRYIRNVSYTLLMGQIVNPFNQALLTAALTWQNPHGQRIIRITLDGTNFGIVLMALLIILISWIMAEGYKLQEEQQYIV